MIWEKGAGELFGVVRVQCLQERDEVLKNEVKSVYEEEDLEERLGRRSRNWTPARVVERIEVPQTEAAIPG